MNANVSRTQLHEMGKPYGGLLVTGVIAVAAVTAAIAFLRIADVLPRDIAIALAPAVATPSQGGLDFTTIHRPPTGPLRVVQIMLASLLLGGFPVAIVGTLLAARTERADLRWTPGWSGVFLAAFVFQLSSAVITLALLIVLVIGLVVFREWSIRGTIVGFVLLCSVVGSVVALRSWRVLRASVFEDRTPIAPL